MGFIPRKTDLPLPSSGVLVRYKQQPQSEEIYVVNAGKIGASFFDQCAVTYTKVGGGDEDMMDYSVVQVLGFYSEQMVAVCKRLGIELPVMKYHNETLIHNLTNTDDNHQKTHEGKTGKAVKQKDVEAAQNGENPWQDESGRNGGTSSQVPDKKPSDNDSQNDGQGQSQGSGEKSEEADKSSVPSDNDKSDDHSVPRQPRCKTKVKIKVS